MTPTPPSRQQLEQPPLGGEVLLHVAVEVEVVARQVGEDAGGEAQVVDAPQRQRVRRHLHHAGAAAVGHHLAQHPLQLGRFRRRPRSRLDLAIADAVADRADAPAADAGRLEDRRQQVRGRRLAVGAGDADERQLVARMAVEGGRSAASASRAFGTCSQGTVDAGRRRRLGDDGDGAARDRLAGERRRRRRCRPRSATNTDPRRDLRASRTPPPVDRRVGRAIDVGTPHGSAARVGRVAGSVGEEIARASLRRLRRVTAAGGRASARRPSPRVRARRPRPAICSTTKPSPVKRRGHADAASASGAPRARSGRAGPASGRRAPARRRGRSSTGATPAAARRRRRRRGRGARRAPAAAG